MEGAAFLGKLVSFPLTDFQCLNTFTSGVESMDKFIRGDFRLSVENHYCQAYAVKLEEEIYQKVLNICSLLSLFEYYCVIVANK